MEDRKSGADDKNNFDITKVSSANAEKGQELSALVDALLVIRCLQCPTDVKGALHFTWMADRPKRVHIRCRSTSSVVCDGQPVR